MFFFNPALKLMLMQILVQVKNIFVLFTSAIGLIGDYCSLDKGILFLQFVLVWKTFCRYLWFIFVYSVFSLQKASKNIKFLQNNLIFYVLFIYTALKLKLTWNNYFMFNTICLYIIYKLYFQALVNIFLKATGLYAVELHIYCVFCVHLVWRILYLFKGNRWPSFKLLLTQCIFETN